MVTSGRRRRTPDDDVGQLDIAFVPGGIRAQRGKFDTIIDEYVYRLSLDSCIDQTGDSGAGGHYSLVDLGPKALRRFHEEALENGDKLTTEEEKLIAHSIGAILREDERGTISVTYYQNTFDDERERDQVWDKIEEICSEYYDGD